MLDRNTCSEAYSIAEIKTLLKRCSRTAPVPQAKGLVDFPRVCGEGIQCMVLQVHTPQTTWEDDPLNMLQQQAQPNSRSGRDGGALGGGNEMASVK